MIRLNGSWARTLRLSQSWNVPWLQECRQVVGLGPDLDGPVDLGVLEGDRDLGGEQLDELELLLAVDGLEPDPLERQDAGRAVAAAERDADQAAVDEPGVAELEDPRVVPLVEHEGRLVVGDDPGREALLAGQPRLHVLGGVDRPWRSAAGAGRSPGRGARSRGCRSRRGRTGARRPGRGSIAASSVVRIDSVTWRSARWLASWRPSASDWARSRPVASALANAWAAKLA